MGFRRAAITAVLVGTLLLLASAARGGEPVGAQETSEGRVVSKVVGGTAVPNGKYPFVTALLDTRFGNTAYQQQFCGGTLIDADSVLTAAHCVDGRPASSLRAAVGRTVLNSNQGSLRGVARVDVYPRFRNITFANDVAVLELSRPVAGVAPVSLATPAQDGLEAPGRTATVAGWGNTETQSPKGDFPQRLHEAPVPLVSDEAARSVYFVRYRPDIEVAAGGAGQDTCQGDSGGPLFARTPGSASGYAQIGITSYGKGCGASTPAVYTEVNEPSTRAFIIARAAE